MGGFGSGRNEYASTPTVRECRHLVANEFTDVVDHPGTTLSMRWGDREDPAESIAVGVLPAEDEHTGQATALRLAYTVTDGWTGEERNRSYIVPLDYTSCNFGGSRPWFQCPGCEERRGKLYRPPRKDLFRCRECHDLGYESSRTSHDEFKTAIRRYRRVHRRLTGEAKRPHDGPLIPERPNGMHLKTYIKHLRELTDAYEAVDEALAARTEAIAKAAGLE